jgi:hypothetical protein
MEGRQKSEEPKKIMGKKKLKLKLADRLKPNSQEKGTLG